MTLSDAERENAVAIRVLGELTVSRNGVRVALPQSKKARALLGYLVLTGRSHRRERLSRLLWDVTDDSRGALRWTLSRVRAAVDGDGPSLIIADRDEVRFDRSSVGLDVLDLSTLLTSDVEQASIDSLERAAALFRGELLEGCDLPDFFDFTAWLAAERERARKAQAKVLSELTARLGEPERALPYARARVKVDPLDEAAGVALVRLLMRSGRKPEAEEHCESVARLLDRTGLPRAPLWPALRAELHTLRDVPTSSVGDERPAEPLRVAPALEQRGDAEIALVGRDLELAELLKAPGKAAESQRPALLLVTGDPGIGKSRLLAEAIDRFEQGGARVLSASAFEADRSLPFLPWMELLRTLDPGTLDEGLREQLSPLLPSTPEGGSAPSDRDRLFRAVTKLLSGAPLIVFDDAQWLDDASTALLHHVLRALSRQPFVVVLAARRGELADNPALVSLLRGARRDRLLFEIELGPLAAEEIQTLAREAKAALDPARIVRESHGSPLVALELARWNGERAGALPGTLREMVADRLDRLPRPALEALQWAATLGSHFAVDVLGELTGQHPEELLRYLELLERHAFLRAAAGASGGYVFPHELVEKAIYLAISEPRRKLMHRRIAELFSASGREEIVANDVSRHAALGGDSELAARACLRAAERSLRVFANDEARGFARRGLRHAAALDEARRIPLEIHLRCAAIYARRPSDVESSVSALLALGERALDFGHANDARAAYRMVSILRWEVARFDEAERASESLLAIGRAGNADERARAMAEAGHCLALLERDLPRAEALLLEARALTEKSAIDLFGVSFGIGLLHRYRGEAERAVQLFDHARHQARHQGERSAEFAAFAQIVEMTYEGGDVEKAEREGEQLRQLGERLREGSEPAFARGLSAVIRYARGDLAALEELDQAVEELRTRDATHRLATILLFAAELDLARRDAERARERAEEARLLAAALERRNDVVVALALVTRAAVERGEDPRPSLQALEALGTVDLSARARRALALLDAAMSRSLPLEGPA